MITAAPVKPNAVNDTLNLDYMVAGTSYSSSTGLSVSGVAPAILAMSNGPTFDFGRVKVSQDVDETFTVTNSGGYPAASMSTANLAAPFSFKGGSYPGNGGTCGTTLASSASCTIGVSFAPWAKVASSAAISVQYWSGAGQSSATRAVVGMGD